MTANNDPFMAFIAEQQRVQAEGLPPVREEGCLMKLLLFILIVIILLLAAVVWEMQTMSDDLGRLNLKVADATTASKLNWQEIERLRRQLKDAEAHLCAAMTRGECSEKGEQ